MIFVTWAIGKKAVNQTQQGRPQHNVAAFIALGGCYKPDITLLTLLRFNKVARRLDYSSAVNICTIAIHTPH